MVRKETIEPSGHRGAAFEQKGMQERNLQNLLKTLSKKEVQKSIEVLAKIPKESWVSIALTATALHNIVNLGGLSEVFTTMTESITTSVGLKIDELTAPLTNEITTAIDAILDPFLLLISPVMNDIGIFMSENAVGTGVGGIVGGLAGMLIGQPVLGALIGAAIGAAIQDPGFGGENRMQDFFGSRGIDLTYRPPRGLTIGEQYMEWYIKTGGTFEEFMAIVNASNLVDSYIDDREELPPGAGRLR